MVPRESEKNTVRFVIVLDFSEHHGDDDDDDDDDDDMTFEHF